MTLDKQKEIVDIYKTIKKGKKAKSITIQKKFAKENHMQENFYKRRKNKRVFDSQTLIISIENSDSNNNSNRVIKLKACSDF